MYKLSHGHHDEAATRSFLNFRANKSGSRNFRGHRFTMCKESCKKEVRKYSFKCRVTDQWNNLPDALVEASSLNAFKNRLDKLWVRNRIMYDPDVDLHATTTAGRTRYETMGVCLKLVLGAIIRPFPQKSIISYYIIKGWCVLEMFHYVIPGSTWRQERNYRLSV